jgi:hypothetical protein
MPLILAGVGVVVVGVVLWLARSGKGAEPGAAQAAEPVPTIDLSKLPDLTPLEGTTEPDWAAMNEYVTRYIKPPFGPNSVQAGDRLMTKGRHSVPAILNGFKRVDLTTKEGAEIGWKVQTMLLQGLCKDTNFGWVRETRPQDVAFNQEVIQRWFRAWEAAQDDDDAWVEIAKAKDIPAGLKAKQ